MRIFTNLTDITVSSKSYGLRLCLLFLGAMIWQASQSQLVAFPGAEGAGRFATGGRGTASAATTVFEVTNLNDDNNPGSLRYALSQPAASRTVVFRVSGTIHLNSQLNIRANTTVAGQTAPGDGICLADRPVAINGDNVIVRYMRFRMGDKNQLLTSPAGCGVPVAPFTASCMPLDGSGNGDAFSNLGNKNIIIDHCSISWSSDEALTIYRGDSVTVQWNFISEPLNYSYHFETGDVDFESHGYGGIWGSRNGSFHHNLIADAKGRCPRFAGSSTYPPGTAGQENADFRNNVIYNWGSYSTNGGEGGNYNIVNNYYKYGPSTATGTSVSIPIKGMIVQPAQTTTAPVLPYGKFYLQGNYVDGYAAITTNNWLGVSMSGGTQADTTLAKAGTEFNIAPVTTHPAQQAYDLVLQYGGASFTRDTLDQRIANDVRNRTGRIIDVQGGYPHGTPYAATVNAWPTLTSTPAPTDTDHDGMPDAYETSNGLNPNDPADRNGIATNLYTNLENYINGIVNAATVTTTGAPLNTFTQNMPLVSASQSYIVSGTGLASDIIITPPASFQVSGDNGASWHGNTTPLTVAQSGGIVLPKTIKVRLNAAAAGPYSGNIANASTGATTSNIAVSGNAINTTAPPNTSLVVAQDGSGDYTTVQAAINAAPTGLTSPYIIYIKNGKYKEKITIPSNKPFLQLVGESVANVILYYTDGASDPLPGGGTVGTQNSASFTVNANDFSAFNITFQNTWGDGTQAVAVLVNADRAVFKNCRFLGNQDTLYIKGGGTPRHYFKDCYIDGNVDFIFGSSIAVFDSSVVYPKSRTTAGSSYITAANTPPGQAYGYVFRNCKIPNNTGVTTYVLGRPWQNSTGSTPLANNKVVFLNSMMGTSISPAGWSTWDAGTNTTLIYYGEYQSKYFNGNPIDISQRVPWSFQLNGTEAASYTNAALFGAWDPCSVSASLCTSENRDIAISNFRTTKTTNSTFSWNISWAKGQIKYELFRSPIRNSGYTSIGEVTATNDTAINFQLTDVLPAAGTSYFYYLVGSKAGFASHITDTLEVSSVPTIITAGILQSFIQDLGTPSLSQNITVSGENLLGNVTLTPPVNFEISSDGGTNWTANPSTIILTPGGNTLAATTIAVRLNAAAVGTYTDSIMLATNGGITKYVKLQGTTAVIGSFTNITLQHWPFTLSNADSATVRAAGVLPSTPTFKNLYLSNGTTVANVPAYSPQFGQAFGASANGDGTWTTGVGGPGGTLRRTHYEQFTVTADNGFKLNIDSLYVSSAFLSTTSNTRLAVVYSLSNFVNDSTDVFTIPGGFANPLTLPNQGAAGLQQFSLSVAGLGGITLQPGKTITFRFYFSCGSTSPGRYAFLKDIKVTGRSTNFADVKEILQHWPFTTNANDSLSVRSAGVAASTPTLYRLYTSNGTTVPAIAAYSPQFGQALGATANGDGSWGTAVGGPGGTLQRTWYEQFTVTANSGYSVRVDSLLVTGAFYNTSSNTRLAAVYSMSNFVSDSADVSTIPGGFASPITLANQTGGPTNQYKLEVAGATGKTLLPGQTITFRFYFSCGSGSPGRYAMLKNVKVIGAAIPTVGPVSTIVTTGTLNNFTQTIGTPSAVQTYTVAGTGLTANITITPPANYEVSANGGTTWFTNASPLVLTQAGGTVATTTISVRLNATTAGTYGGNITNASTGATAMNVAVNGTATPASFITATGTLNAFTQILGTPSASQTYSVSGTGLTQNLTITPLANYEVSADGGTTWFTNVSPLVLTQTAGVVAATTISVRLNATALGAYNGNIVHVSSGATTVNVPVTGNTVPVPSITVTGTLNAFSHTVGTPSAAQTYTISGINLAGNVTVTPPVNFEVSGDGGTTWRTNATPLVLTPTAGTLANTTISVRMNATAAGPFTANITHTSTSAPTVLLPVTGNAIPTPLITLTGTLTAFTQVLGVVSPVKTYTVTGANLTGNITITPPADYEISSNGGTNWSTVPIVLTQAGGTVAATTISVRLNSAVLGAHAGNITHVSSGAVTKNMAVTGNTVPKPVIIVTENFTTFIQTVGTAAPVQSYTVAGTNLTGNIIITPPAHFQVSTNNGSSWQSTAATLTRVNGAVAPTTVLIRLYVPVTGMFSGILTHTSSDADAVDVNLDGYNKAAGEYVIYPSPASRVVFLAHPITTEKAVITFYTTSGQKMATYSTQPGTIETPIDVQLLPQGIYYVEYRLGEKKVLLKFVKS